MKSLKLPSILLLVAFMILGVISVSAQERPPTKEELEKMMQELDPETREMMKKMGIAIPDISKLGTALSGSYEVNGGVSVFPEKDEARIAAAKKTNLKVADLAPYLSKVHAAVSAKFGSEATADAKELYGLAGSAAEGAQIANGLWMFGSTAYAILVMGNTLQTDPQNPDYLNNYAAFLTMAGAEESALPILKYLNSTYPKNSTVLNNMAQAWFGLGDISAAEAYIDSTIVLYPGHSQANLTKSVIEEKKGNKTEAAKALKESIKTAYSPEKEKKIKELGHKVTPQDIPMNPPLNEDPLGLVHMNWPKYPQTVFESEYLEQEWEDYREGLRIQSDAIQEKMQRAEEELENAMADPMGRLIGGKMNKRLPAMQLVFSPKVQALRDYYDEENGEMEYKKYTEMLESQDALPERIYEIEQAYEKKMEELQKSIGRLIGEGSSSADMARYCAAINEHNNNFLKEVNALLESENMKMIAYWRETLSRRMNFFRYTLLPEEFEMEKLKTQAMWLGFISGQEVRFVSPCPYVDYDAEEGPKTAKLAEFYDMTCTQKSEMNLIIGSITIECNKMTTKLDSKFLKFSVKENMDTDEIIQGSVEIGTDFDLADASEYGPIKAELKGEISGFIEFDGQGITDVGIKAGAKAAFGSNLISEGQTKTSLGFVEDPSTTLIGAEARWGWNSGPSLEGKSILQGLSALKN